MVIFFVVVLWAGTAWLLYPLVVLDSVDVTNAKIYFYRSVFGVTILLIMFGKTFFDILFPHVTSRRTPVVQTVFLSLYCMVIAAGIIFMVARMIVLFLKSRDSGVVF
ncbi:MAG: hypothetical protein JXB26_02345 [Candidatus Aminicenantes bacterium]|nr:hypothetical protein [Candidatus Aminicenantes bacterium]